MRTELDTSNIDLCLAQESPEVVSMSEELGLHPLVVSLLSGRGYKDSDSIKKFLSPSLREGLPNPFEMKGADEAGRKIVDAVIAGKKIIIVSDYDVDGVTSGSQLLLYLKTLGASISSYTPSRFLDGYGLSKDLVRRFSDSGFEVLITLDCGISDIEEIALAKSLGLETIIIDHHVPDELPDADVIVDPAQDGCCFSSYQMSAAGLVWMILIVVRRVWNELEEEQSKVAPDPKEFLDLAALGTICDMVPLKGPNRVIAKKGLELIARNERLGLRSLFEASSLKITKRLGAGQVGFTVGPRINAVGRMGDATEAVELLTTEDSKRALSLAKRMERSNKSRQEVEAENLDRALSIIGEPAGGALFVWDSSFHIGVIGIVAQRVVEKFYLPCAVAAPAEPDDPEGLYKASVRSISGFNVVDSLRELSPLLLNFGGHKAAGGFSIRYENLATFSKEFNALAEKVLSEDDFIKKQRVDLEVGLSDLTFDFVESLGKLSPFGIGNPTPVFLSRDLEVDSIKPIGRQHLRLSLAGKGVKLPAVAWKFAGNPLLVKGSRVDVAYTAEINEYKGLASVQLNIKDVFQTNGR